MPLTAVLIILLITFILILKYPELGFAILLMNSVLKPLLGDNYPFFASVDITLLVFLITTLGILRSYLLVYREIEIPLNTLVIYIFFIGYLAFCTLYSRSFYYGMSKLVRFLLFGNFLFWGGVIIFQNSQAVKRFIKFTRYLCLLLAIAHLIFLFILLINLDFRLIYTQRFAIAGNVIGSSRIFGMGLILWLIGIFEGQSKFSRVFTLLALFILVVALISTNTRGPFLALILSAPFIFLAISRRGIRIVLLILVAITLIGVMTFVLLPEQMTNRYIAQFTKPDYPGAEILNLTLSTTLRLFLWRSALEGFQGSSFLEAILGHGLGSFAYIWPGFDSAGYPHNIFLELLYEGGLILTGIFVVLLFLTLRLFYRGLVMEKGGIDYRYLFTFLTFIYFLLNSMVSGDINDNRLLLIFWGGLLGMIASKVRQFSIN